MMSRNLGFVFTASTALLLGWHSPALAYLDPGTGSMILQGIIGAVVGGLIALKLYWARLKNFLSSGRSRGTAENNDRDHDSN